VKRAEGLTYGKKMAAGMQYFYCTLHHEPVSASGVQIMKGIVSRDEYIFEGL
jgi:hypothetical protein